VTARIRKPFLFLFILFVGLGIYYPAIFNSTFSIDDMDMIRRMEGQEFSLSKLFLPRSSFYYRPILILSFWVDKWLWDFQPSFALLENVLLHCCNALLIFVITQKVSAHLKNAVTIAFGASLLFIVHPIATESVNWMSGRTDLLATMFVLLSVVLLLKALESGAYSVLILSLGVFVAGIFSKEIVCTFFPAALFLIWIYRPRFPGHGFASTWKPMTLYASPVVLVLGGYVLWRAVKFDHHARGFSHLLERIPYEGVDFFRVAFKVFGFYCKKLILPLPLNFSIIKVDDLYALLGVIIFAVWIYLLWKRPAQSVFLLISLFLISPAIVIALTGIAWTPLAERYIYLPTAFFVITVSLGIAKLHLKHYWRNGIALLLVLWVGSSAVASTQRSMLWQDKKALYADTLRKSPDFNKLRNEYGLQLQNDNMTSAARTQFQEATGDNGTDLGVINEARLLMMQDDHEGARDLLVAHYPDIKSMQLSALKMLGYIEVRRLGSFKEGSKQQKLILDDLYAIYARLYEKSRDPFYYYRIGQIALGQDDKEKAQRFFAQAYRLSGSNTHYKEVAGVLAEKLKRETE